MVDREPAQQSNELARLGPGILVAGEDVRERIDNDEARLALSDDGLKRVPNRRRSDDSRAFLSPQP